MRYIFRSKWWALLWAAGICLTAAQFADSRGAATDNNAADAANALDFGN